MSDTTGGTWDDASSPASARIARRFEADWRRSPASARPDPFAYLPERPEDRPGARLALLRAEMGLRWEAGLEATPEHYRDRYPGLDPQTMVALAYEEFCLREEAGDAPDPADFERRLPDLAGPLRRVFEVHELVGGPAGPSIGSTLTNGGHGTAGTMRDGLGSLLAEPCATTATAVAFPEVGETIGGFRLVEELGRGSFARVFLARERLLADRPVALKVATAGSREPQTLALLQHTHIVPVHSYRVDPLTGLHLLCMPFFGRSTLADLLDDPAIASARGGADLIEILDRIEPPPRGLPDGRTAARRALADRSIAGALAWWGARLAEALQHAHDRGVLHRDVKPSNVLVTGDGLPMLLDFNLARGPRIVGPAEDGAAKLGGTLAYMAPEHIEALADGLDEGVDARADLFALGVVLFEAIAGQRPFPVVRKGRSVPEALLQTAEQRRGGPPPLRRNGRRVSMAFEAILRRCLEADPDRRYDSAADLAEDLAAFADDAALHHAAEPLPSRSIRWLRRHRLRFAVAAPAAVALVTLAASLHDGRVRRIEARGEIRRAIDRADLAEQNGKLDAAIQGFEFAERAAAARDGASADLLREAAARRIRAKYRHTLELHASEFFDQAEELRYRLFGFVVPESPPGEALEALLSPFNVMRDPDWADQDDLFLLPEAHRHRLLDGVPELLFLRAVHLRLTEGAGAPIFDRIGLLRARASRAMPPDDPRRAPWEAIATSADIEARPSAIPATVGRDATRRRAEAAFLWGTYHAARFQWTGATSDADRAIDWLETACLGRPDDYWARFYLAAFALEAGRDSEALRHADSAVALRPDSAWARFNRALASHANGDRLASIRDLEAAALLIRDGDRDRLSERIALNLGLVRLESGDRDGARVALGSILDDSPPAGTRLGGSFAPLAAMAAGRSAPLASPLAFALIAAADRGQFDRAAVLNLARLDAEAGHPGRALLAYADLLASEPARVDARLGRALVLLSIGEASAALAALDVLVDGAGGPIRTGGRPDPEAEAHAAEVLELRSRCELMLGRVEAAFRDASASMTFGPNPDRERLRLRALIADGRHEALHLDDPKVLDLLPMPGPDLARDLRIAAEALRQPPIGVEASPVPRMLTRAVLLASLGDRSAAESAATEAVVLAPYAPEPRLVRGRVRLRFGDRDGAIDDFHAALELDAHSASARLARGVVFAIQGRSSEALADLDAARALGLDSAELHRARAQALARLGRSPEALAAMSTALARDPRNPLLHLARARLLADAGHREAALDDVIAASDVAADRPELRALAALYRALLFNGRPTRSRSLTGDDHVLPADLRPRQGAVERVERPPDRDPPAEDREDHVGRERRQG